jgi:sec-independent protein translocase protein TatC
MPLREHLRELRNRILLVVAGLALGAVLGWIWYPTIFEWLQAPVADLADQRDQLIVLNFAGVATPLDLQIKLSLFAGAILTSPWWIYQLWAFITPGLTRRERWYTIGFLVTGVPFFLVGAALAWWILPKAVSLLAGLTPEDAANVIDAQAYLGFVMRIVLAFGLAFLLPVVMVGLNLAGLVRARTLIGAWRWAVLLAFVFAAVATPTADAVSMLALGIPICALYFGAVGISAVTDRRRDRRAAAPSAAASAGERT